MEMDGRKTWFVRDNGWGFDMRKPYGLGGTGQGATFFFTLGE